MPKIKVYLDTNTVLDFFINQARYFKNKGELKIPEKAKFILENIENLDIVVSFLVEAEVTRELVAGYDMPEDIVRATWEDFIRTYSCKYIESFGFDRSLVGLVAKTKMKLRTMFNFQHLYIAMHENAYFVSGDKDLAEKVRVIGLYDRIISYPELRNLISKLS